MLPGARLTLPGQLIYHVRAVKRLMSVTKTHACLRQEESEQQAKVSAARQCGKPCWRPLPACPHPCQRPCHPDSCGSECTEQVTVRCACKCAFPPHACWPLSALCSLVVMRIKQTC